MPGASCSNRLAIPDPWRRNVDAGLELIDDLELQIARLTVELKRQGADHPYIRFGHRARVRLDQRLLPVGSHNPVGVSAEIATGATARHLGILASMLRRFDDAAEHFEHALALDTRSGARPSLAHTQHNYGRMLIARDDRGDRDAAHALIADALAASS